MMPPEHQVLNFGIGGGNNHSVRGSALIASARQFATSLPGRAWRFIQQRVSREKQHKWLSQAYRAAEKQATGKTGVVATARAAGKDAIDWIEVAFQGMRGSALTLLLVAALHGPFIAAPAIRGVPSAAEGQTFLFNLWQVSGAVLGIAFVILIFIIETIHRTDQGFVWERFSRTPRLYVVTSFVLSTIGAIGFGAYALGGHVGNPPGLLNLFVLDGLLFAAAMIAVLLLYADVLRLLGAGAIHDLAIRSLTAVVRASVSRTLQSRMTENILRQECQSFGMLVHPGTRDWPGMEAVRLPARGVVEDVNLERLRALARSLGGSVTPTGLVALTIGSRVTENETVAMLLRRECIRDNVADAVVKCFRIAPREPEPKIDLEPAFGFLTEQALTAIESGRLGQFQNALAGLQEPARMVVQTLRERGIVLDAATARNIFSFEWPAFERPFREYERIAEAAARSSDANIVVEATGWPFEMMLLALENKDHYFFRQAVHHLPYLYRISGSRETSDRARPLIAERAWRHLKEFGWYIESYAKTAPDIGTVATYAAYATELLDAYTTLLKMAIDAGDRTYFEVAARGFWQAFRTEDDLDLLMDDDGLGKEGEPADPAETLRRAKLEFTRSVRDRREAVWMSLGAWVCQRWAGSRLTAEMAKAAYDTIARPFADFSNLWRAFNTAVAAESSDRLPLSDWQLEDQPEGEAVWIRPEAHLTTFFTLVALTNIPAGIDERFKSLAPPHEASWIKTQVEGALNTFNENMALWSQLIGDADRSDKGNTLRRLLDAAVAYQQRLLEERVMEQELSSSKLADFKASFLASWFASGLMRRLFQDAGRIEFVEGSRADDKVLSIYTFMKKDPFVEDTGGVHWFDVGDNYGRGVASGEDEGIYRELREAAQVDSVGARPFPVKLFEVIGLMREAGMDPDTILIAHFDLLRLLRGAPEYVPDYAMRADRPPLFEGTFDGVPIYMRGGVPANEVMIAALAKAARVRQYMKDGESIFRAFEVKAFSEAEANEIVSGDRQVLPPEQRELPKDEAIEYLRGHVTVKIQESLEVQVDNKEGLRVLVLDSATAGDEE